MVSIDEDLMFDVQILFSLGFFSNLLHRQRSCVKAVVGRRLMLRNLEGQILSLMLKILAIS